MQSAQAVTDWSQNHQRTAFFNLWLILTTENKPKTKNHTHMLITLSTEILHLPPNSSKILHKFSMAVIKNHSTTLRNWEHPIRGSQCEVWDLVWIAYEEENEKINTWTSVCNCFWKPATISGSVFRGNGLRSTRLRLLASDTSTREKW
jgi:hypothetical protein